MSSAFESNSLPEDAQYDYGHRQRDQRNTVSDGVANFNRPEESILKRDLKTTHSALFRVNSIATGF